MTRIDITSEDIRNGVALDPHRDPVARAICRKMHRPPEAVDVTPIRIVIHFLGGQAIYDTPDLVAAFIDRFDRTQGGDPFSFMLPEPVVHVY